MFERLGKSPVKPVSTPGVPATGMGKPVMASNVLGVMHNGGKVEKTGGYSLEKGEKVIPAKEKKGKEREKEKDTPDLRPAASCGPATTLLPT